MMPKKKIITKFHLLESTHYPSYWRADGFYCSLKVINTGSKIIRINNFEPVFRIRIELTTDPDPAFQVNTDPDPDPDLIPDSDAGFL